MKMEGRECLRGESLPPAIEREFSPENFSAYARMCEELAIRIAEKIEEKEERKDEGKCAILLPSRGALPIFNGVMLAMRYLGKGGKINLPPLACFDYVRNVLGEERIGSQIDHNVETLIFPFTADGDFRSVNEDEEGKIVAGMRRFGAKVVAELLKPPNERDGLEYLIFSAFLEVVEGREEIAFKQKSQIDTLLMIDTVISGRASFTILEGLRENGIRIGEWGGVIPFLVVDANGERLDSRFRFYVDRCPNCLKVPRIMTEDRGAALEGVVAVLYPNLILAAHRDIYPQGYPLFGNWHNVPSPAMDIYGGIFDSFLNVLKEEIDRHNIDEARQNFLRKLREANVLRGGENIEGRMLNRVWPIRETTETSAHVIQITYPYEVVNRILRRIEERLKNG